MYLYILTILQLKDVYLQEVSFDFVRDCAVLLGSELVGGASYDGLEFGFKVNLRFACVVGSTLLESAADLLHTNRSLIMFNLCYGQ